MTVNLLFFPIYAFFSIYAVVQSSAYKEEFYHKAPVSLLLLGLIWSFAFVGYAFPDHWAPVLISVLLLVNMSGEWYLTKFVLEGDFKNSQKGFMFFSVFHPIILLLFAREGLNWIALVGALLIAGGILIPLWKTRFMDSGLSRRLSVLVNALGLALDFSAVVNFTLVHGDGWALMGVILLFLASCVSFLSLSGRVGEKKRGVSSLPPWTYLILHYGAILCFTLAVCPRTL